MFFPTAPSYIPPLLSVSEFSVGTGGRVAISDPRVSGLLDGASTAVRRYCGWHVAGVIEQSFRGDYDGGRLIVLPTLRMVDLLAFKIHGQAVPVSEVEWSHNGEIRLNGCFAPGFRCVEVTIRHGFDDAGALGQVVQQVVGNAISSPLGATREQAGAVSVSWATTAPGVSGGISLLERDYAILDHYRLPRGV